MKTTTYFDIAHSCVGCYALLSVHTGRLHGIYASADEAAAEAELIRQRGGAVVVALIG